MKEELKYHGKAITSMTKNELEEQYSKNKKRLAVRSSVLGIFSIAAFVALPPLTLIPIGFGGITAKWLCDNNKEIKHEIEKR